MEATVIYVMESWPLQLALQTPSRRREDMVLAEDARVWRRGVLVGPGALRPGQRVQLMKRTGTGEIVELKILD